MISAYVKNSLTMISLKQLILCVCIGISNGIGVLATTKRPHIIVILADDLGWNDISFHGSNQIPTPNIDALAFNGIILNNHYVQALCTPSRSAFLTGKYPIHTGMQHDVILENEPWGLPLEEKLLPEYLREAGYATHAIGKWHLGFFKHEYTPTYRGFDSHFGYWNGLQDYYDHNVYVTLNGSIKGLDMRRNMDVAYDTVGKYSTDLFTEEAVYLINNHNPEKPMFMYLSHLAAHTGNRNNPLQAPDEEIAKFSHIEDPERRVYAAMVSLLDKSVGEVVAALRAKHMLEDSIVMFLADNGAPTFGIHANHGSNFPLRGMKASPFEGGVRGAAAIWSPLLNTTQAISNQLMHISDWVPTLLSAAGINETFTSLDGRNMWNALQDPETLSNRYDVVLNIETDYAAYRKGDWKYINGSGNPKEWYPSGWYGHSGLDLDPSHEYDEEKVLNSKAGIALTGLLTSLQLKERLQEISDTDSFFRKKPLLSKETIQLLRKEATVVCPKLNESEVNPITVCEPTESPCLFNLKADPCEQINLAAQQPLILRNLEEALYTYRKSALHPRNVPEDPMADPVHWNNVWSNWQDPPSHSKTFTHSNILLLAVIVILFIIVLVILLIISVKGCNPSLSRNFKLNNFLKTLDDSHNVDDINGEYNRNSRRNVKKDQCQTEFERTTSTVNLKEVIRHVD